MTCDRCANRVRQALYALEGVREVEVSLEQKEVRVCMEREVPFDLLKSAVEEQGYRVVS